MSGNPSQYSDMKPGTLFKVLDDDTVYKLVGYNTMGDSIIYYPADVENMNGNLDINLYENVVEILDMGYADHEPKPPTTTFFLFCASRRPQLKEQHPDWKITKVAKQLSEEWRELGESEKNLFETKAEKDRERYGRELKAYNPN